MNPPLTLIPTPTYGVFANKHRRGIPNDCMAYTLAFLSAYKLRAGRIVYKLWNQARGLKCVAYEFNRELSRLSHALGKDGIVPVPPCLF